MSTPTEYLRALDLADHFLRQLAKYEEPTYYDGKACVPKAILEVARNILRHHPPKVIRETMGTASDDKAEIAWLHSLLAANGFAVSEPKEATNG